MTSIVGWLGSGLLIVSLAQSKARRLHSFNLAASVLLLTYNAAIHAAPQIAMNALLVIVNLWKIIQLGQPAAQAASKASPEVTPRTG
jgi:hypothetical protein